MLSPNEALSICFLHQNNHLATRNSGGNLCWHAWGSEVTPVSVPQRQQKSCIILADVHIPRDWKLTASEKKLSDFISPFKGSHNIMMSCYVRSSSTDLYQVLWANRHSPFFSWEMTRHLLISPFMDQMLLFHLYGTLPWFYVILKSSGLFWCNMTVTGAPKLMLPVHQHAAPAWIVSQKCSVYIRIVLRHWFGPSGGKFQTSFQ